MRLELICSGLTKLLVDNNYSPTTINFYKREWKKLNDFLNTHNLQVTIYEKCGAEIFKIYTICL